MGTGEPVRTIVWADPAQIPFVRAIAESSGLSIAVAGSPARGQSGTVAAGLDATAADDLRSVLAEVDAGIVLLASVGDFGSGGIPQDAKAVAAAQARGVRIASLEPIPTSALDLEAGGWLTSVPGASPVQGIRFLGLPRLARPFRDAHETLTAFGPPRTVLIESWSLEYHGTLAARLMGAMDLALSLLGDASTIDATHVSTSHLRAPAAPAQSLQELHGDLTATFRSVDGRSAVIAASNAAGRWNTCITLLSEQGRLRFYDDGFEWIGPDGAKRDELRAPGRRRATEAVDHGVTVIAEGIQRLLDPSNPDAAPIDIGAILAASQAALLSARTGQPESPAMITRMMST